MKSEISIVSGILADGLPLLTKHVGTGAAMELSSSVAQRQTDATPTVMVFGIYNAGKSTLLNALIGEERALMSDCPETSVVTSYEWNGFKLLDTPGIDAPAEHECVSRAQLSESDIVLFILSTNGSFDENAIYDEILKIVREKKPIMVIINNKDGYSESDPDYRAIYDKVLINLETAGQAHGLNNLSELVPVRLVNAKLALKGKLSGKDSLIAASGVIPLGRDIEALLRKSGAHDVAVTLSTKVGKLIDAALDKLKILDADVDAKQVAEQQATLRGEKDRVTAAVNNSIHRAAMGFRSTFQSAIENRDESAMQTAMQTAIASTTQVMEREIKVAGEILSEIGTNLAAAAPIHVVAEAKAVQFGLEASAESDAKESSSLSTPIIDGVKKIAPELWKKGIEEETKAATKVALELAKEYIPSLMVGKGPKTIEKIAGKAGVVAGKAGPLIGPAIDAVRGIYDYYQAAKKQNEDERAQRRQAQALADHVEQTTANLESELKDACRAVLIPMFLPLDKALTERSKNLNRDNLAAISDRQSLELLKLRLENVY